MKKFVLIFRQGARILSDDEQKVRGEAVKAWALSQIENGHKLDPRVVSGQNYRFGEATENGPIASSHVIAVNFLEASDLDEALTIVQSHPGLGYGVNIEVGEWSSPLAAAAALASANN